MFKFTPRPLYLQRNTPITIVQETGWAPEPVCKGMGTRKCVYLTGVRTPDSPARSQVCVATTLLLLPLVNRTIDLLVLEMDI